MNNNHINKMSKFCYLTVYTVRPNTYIFILKLNEFTLVPPSMTNGHE